MGSYEFIDSIDRSSRDYQYDELRVVRSKETGILYYATDSGCSCPMPFEKEDADFPAAWTPIKRGESWRAFVAAVQNWAHGSEYLKVGEVEQFIDKVKEALKAKAPA